MTNDDQSDTARRSDVVCANIGSDGEAVPSRSETICAKRRQVLHAVTRLVERTYPDVMAPAVLETLQRLDGRTYDDVEEERALAEICGWLGCSEKPTHHPLSLRVHVTQHHQQTHRLARFCSLCCFERSLRLQQALPDVPLWMRDEESTCVEIDWDAVMAEEESTEEVALENKKSRKEQKSTTIYQHELYVGPVNVESSDSESEAVGLDWRHFRLDDQQTVSKEKETQQNMDTASTQGRVPSVDHIRLRHFQKDNRGRLKPRVAPIALIEAPRLDPRQVRRVE